MTYTTYTPLTVARGGAATFTVYGHPGTTVDNGLLLESGNTFLLTETGDLILIA